MKTIQIHGTQAPVRRAILEIVTDFLEKDGSAHLIQILSHSGTNETSFTTDYFKLANAVFDNVCELATSLGASDAKVTRVL